MLIELLVGLSVGALVLGAAIAALLVAREAASAVGEMSLLQQQTSHAMRMLGLQIRSAGSVALEPGPDGSFGFATAPTENTVPAVQGSDGIRGASDSLRVWRISTSLLPGQQEDCLGQKIAPGQRIEATFDVDAKGALRCKGASRPQPLVTGVSAFRLRYRVRQGEQVRDLRAGEVDAAGLWPAVVAVAVCLDLRGEERNTAHDGRYTDCSSNQIGNVGRLHLVTRKLFQVRTRSED
ncbi:hypothetical protein [Variovorax sp. OV329]|uniref:hypothetical protein n=1 Tax=Variovorax sp. OV329 TaxID=1882825 RepID=UPI0008E5EE96|nr:hypothetical protein [Variovorax sp. OV329]SFN15907.1 type IV pilus assembly protein PilW [Variovorax sp. OV329]